MLYPAPAQCRPSGYVHTTDGKGSASAGHVGSEWRFHKRRKKTRIAHATRPLCCFLSIQASNLPPCSTQPGCTVHDGSHLTGSGISSNVECIRLDGKCSTRNDDISLVFILKLHTCMPHNMFCTTRPATREQSCRNGLPRPAGKQAEQAYVRWRKEKS